MKKVAVVVGIIIFGVSGLVFGNETYDENLKKAGQQALAVRETELKRLAQEINNYIQKIAKDGKATGKEMLVLERKVAKFRKKKRKADRHLTIYKLATETKLRPEVTKLIDKYRKGYVVRYRDITGEARKLFAGLTGKDIEVQSRINWENFEIFFILLLVSIFFFWKGVRLKKRLLKPLILAIALILICFFLLILIFF